jgi:hypothetical protein
MSTIRRRRRESRMGLNLWKRHELLFDEVKPAPSYDGYTNGSPTDDLADFISDEMREDLSRNRTELVAFWKSGAYTADVFPDSLPWLFVHGSADKFPWAAKQFDKE